MSGFLLPMRSTLACMQVRFPWGVSMVVNRALTEPSLGKRYEGKPTASHPKTKLSRILV